MRTQWRTGADGSKTGLDYAGVRAILAEQRLAADARRDAFTGIQACEAALLEVWEGQREAEALARDAQQLQRELRAGMGRG